MPRKKPGRKKARKPKTENEPDAAEVAFATAVEDMQRLDEYGVKVKVTGETDSATLEALRPLLSAEEFRVLRETGVYTDVALDAPYVPKSLPYEFPASGVRSAPLAMPIMALPDDAPRAAAQDAALGQEIRHLGTLLTPCEYKQLLTILIFEHVDRQPLTHTDVSDFVMIAIAPSLAQKLASELDAQYKYTTAQFVQVYMKLRHVILGQKIMLESAHVDALVYLLSPYKLEPLRPEDETPVSAVRALRRVLNTEMLQRADLPTSSFRFSVDEIRDLIDM